MEGGEDEHYGEVGGGEIRNRPVKFVVGHSAGKVEAKMSAMVSRVGSKEVSGETTVVQDAEVDELPETGWNGACDVEARNDSVPVRIVRNRLDIGLINDNTRI